MRLRSLFFVVALVAAVLVGLIPGSASAFGRRTLTIVTTGHSFPAAIVAVPTNADLFRSRAEFIFVDHAPTPTQVIKEEFRFGPLGRVREVRQTTVIGSGR